MELACLLLSAALAISVIVIFVLHSLLYEAREQGEKWKQRNAAIYEDYNRLSSKYVMFLDKNTTETEKNNKNLSGLIDKLGRMS